MTPNRPALSYYVSLAASLAFAATAPAANAGQAHAPAAPAPTKSRICLVLPRAQLGQGSSGADVGEPVRQTMISYLSGPTVEIIPLAARIPVQVDAGCERTTRTGENSTQSGASRLPADMATRVGQRARRQQTD